MDDWDKIISGLPGTHILQTEEWGSVKECYGWQMIPQKWVNSSGEVQAAALELKRRFSIGRWTSKLSMIYVPRGPLLNWNSDDLRKQTLDDLQELSALSGVILIKIDPDVILESGYPGQPDWCEFESGTIVKSDLNKRGWMFSSEQIQFQNSMILDLTGSEEEWLARMKQKTRYNLRIAFKKGVQVREGGYDDFPLIYRMYAETSIRDGFIIRLEDYYSKVWRTFIEHNMADLLVAEYQNEPIAALFLFHFANKAWYLYGMSSQVHRDKMPNYLLQWKAMQLARDHGCKSYDLWGAPDKLDESDPLWGVYRFKEGLGAKVIHTLGAWDYTSRPQLYRLFNRTLPAILNIMRRRGEKSIRRMVSA